MRGIGLVMTAGIRNNLRLKTAFFIVVAVTVICVAGIALIFCLQFIAPEAASPMPDMTKLEAYLSLVVYTTVLLCVGITLNAFGFQSMVREKARGNLQALLASPLKAGDIWLGKSLAVFVPGLVLGILAAVLVLVFINAVYFLPEIGFIFSWWLAVTSLIAVPLMYLALGLLVHLVGFTSRAASGNVIAQVFLPVMITLMINLLVRDVLDASSWLFMVVNLGLAAVIGFIVLILRLRLTPEKIVLSG